jgi:HEAT repeat protein
MNPRILSNLIALTGLFAATGAIAAPASDLSKLVAEVAKYQSGQSREPLDQVERLIRDSATNRAFRIQIEGALTNLLAPTATYEARRFACMQLAVIGTENSIPALAGMLKRDDSIALACYVLAQLPTREVGEVLRDALLTVAGTNRIPVIDALGTLRDAEAAKSIANLTGHARRPVAEAAIIALGRIANKPALDALAELRRSPATDTYRLVVESSLIAADRVASADAKAAGAIYDELQRPAQPPYVRRAAFEGMLRVDSKNAETLILVALNANDAVLKPAAIAALRTLPGRGVSKKFGQILPKLSPADQVLLIDALAVRNDAPAREAIEGELTAKNAAVRLAAIGAVGAVGDATSVPVLVKMLGGKPSDEERQAIESALVGLKGGEAVDRALGAQLRQDDAGAKALLVSVLGRRGSRGAVAVLLAEADSTDAATAKAAFQALGRVATGDDLSAVVDKLVRLKAPAAREAAEDAVSKALSRTPEAPKRADVVCSALSKAEDMETRLALIRLLPACGTVKALAPLKAASGESDLRVRDAAVRALAEWPDAGAWDVLMGVYRQPQTEGHRVVALRALVRLAGDENARPSALLIERYKGLLEGAKTDDDRKLILGALAGCLRPEALPLVLPMLANPALKSEATLAVKKIAEAIKETNPQSAREALQKVN